MTIKELLYISTIKLNDKVFIDRKRFISEVLLSSIIKKPRIYLHSNDTKQVNKTAIDSMLDSITLLNKGYPLEYITKEVSFYSNTFYIDEGALIPRPETEILVTKAFEIIQTYNLTHIYEIGIGSGVISIILALLNKNLKITATDISIDALKIAIKNINIHSKKDKTLKNRINLINTNLLDKINFNKNTLIVSNPPYINNDYKINENLKYEPKEALFGGEIGDEVLKQIIAMDAKFLCCEVGYNQIYLKHYLNKYNNVKFYCDYSGLTRGFTADKL